MIGSKTRMIVIGRMTIDRVSCFMPVLYTGGRVMASIKYQNSYNAQSDFKASKDQADIYTIQ